MKNSGVSKLAAVGPGRFTSAKYTNMLEEILLPSVQAWLFPDDEPFYLIQDNSPVHICWADRSSLPSILTVHYCHIHPDPQT